MFLGGLVSFGVLGMAGYLVNVALVGGVLAVFAMIGYPPGLVFAAGFLPHGVFEIPALMLVSAALLQIGAVLVTPQAGKSMGEVLLEQLAEGAGDPGWRRLAAAGDCALSSRPTLRPSCSRAFSGETMTQLIILGSSNAIASDAHDNTHMVLVGSSRTVVIDCVSSPLIRLGKVGVTFDQVTDLILTHFHPDHVSGVPLLLMDMWLLGRSDTATCAWAEPYRRAHSNPHGTVRLEILAGVLSRFFPRPA